MAVSLSDAAQDEAGKARESTGVEVMELRLFLKEGKILWVEPIDPQDIKNSQATGKEYQVDIVPDLREENVRQVSPVAVRQSSPACTYWYIIVTRNGIEKICLF